MIPVGYDCKYYSSQREWQLANKTSLIEYLLSYTCDLFYLHTLRCSFLTSRFIALLHESVCDVFTTLLFCVNLLAEPVCNEQQGS